MYPEKQASKQAPILGTLSCGENWQLCSAGIKEREPCEFFKESFENMLVFNVY